VTAAATDTPAAFEGWAIVELMGHRRLAGRVSEVQLDGRDRPRRRDAAAAGTAVGT
jgi:hypothetical protein